VSVVRSASLSTWPTVAVQGQRQTSNGDEKEHIDKVENDSVGWAVDVPATPTDDVVRAETTSPEMTSPDARSQVAGGLWVELSGSSSEYLTPPTHRGPDTTTSVTASATVTKVCDAASQTAPDSDSKLHLTEVQMAHPERSNLAAWVTPVCETRSSAVDTGDHFVQVQTMRLSHPEEKTVRQTNAGHLSRPEHNKAVAASDDETYAAVDAVAVRSEHISCAEDRTMVTASRVISGAVTPAIRSVVQTAAHSSLSEQNKLVTVSAAVRRVTLPAVDTRSHVSFTEVHSTHLEQTAANNRDDKTSGRDRRSAVVKVTRRHSEATLPSSDLLSRHSPHHCRPSASSVREPKTAPVHRRPTIERIGPESLAVVSGLAAYVAALTPRDRGTSKPAALSQRVTDSGRHGTSSKSYVSMWRKRVATYEAFVNRCQATSLTGVRSQHRRL